MVDLLLTDWLLFGWSAARPPFWRILLPHIPQIRYKQHESGGEVLLGFVLGHFVRRVIDAVNSPLLPNSVLRQLFWYLSGALQVYQHLFRRTRGVLDDGTEVGP